MTKSQHLDLPLFEYEYPTKVLAFPLAKRVGKVRCVAAVMRSMKSEKAADAYYRKIDSSLKKQLINSGVQKFKINGELDSFWNAGGLELDRD